MGADFMAVCHARREYILLGRPLRQGGITEDDAAVLIYEWANLPVVFLSDQGEQQDLYSLIRTGDVATYGHMMECPASAWTAYARRRATQPGMVPSCTCSYRQLNTSSK